MRIKDGYTTRGPQQRPQGRTRFPHAPLQPSFIGRQGTIRSLLRQAIMHSKSNPSVLVRVRGPVASHPHHAHACAWWGSPAAPPQCGDEQSAIQPKTEGILTKKEDAPQYFEVRPGDSGMLHDRTVRRNAASVLLEICNENQIVDEYLSIFSRFVRNIS